MSCKYSRLYTKIILSSPKTSGPNLEKFQAPYFNIMVYIPPEIHYLCCWLLSKINPTKYKMRAVRSKSVL